MVMDKDEYVIRIVSATSGQEVAALDYLNIIDFVQTKVDQVILLVKIFNNPSETHRLMVWNFLKTEENITKS